MNNGYFDNIGDNGGTEKLERKWKITKVFKHDNGIQISFTFHRKYPTKKLLQGYF